MGTTSTAARSLYKLFVGNVPWTVSGLELKQYFSQFGYVADAIVIFDRETGLTKHYGFVELNNKATYEAILHKSSHSLDGRNLVVQSATV